MRSRADSRANRFALPVCALVAALALAAALGAPVVVAGSQPQESIGGGAATDATANRTPEASDIARAVAVLTSDANLSGERTVRTLRWRDRSTQAREVPEWLRWFRGLGGWIDQSARYLVWVAVAVGILLLGTHAARLWRARVVTPEAEAFVAPTHVGDLDIRPEALPSDIGAAARGLWDAGQHRAALALLYRGLLSRLVHVHKVPIRDSTTEGDCLRLTAQRVPGSPHEYATRLVRLWQLAVYGHADAPESTVHRLCDEFATALDGGPSTTTPPTGATGAPA